MIWFSAVSLGGRLLGVGASCSGLGDYQPALGSTVYRRRAGGREVRLVPWGSMEAPNTSLRTAVYPLKKSGAKKKCSAMLMFVGRDDPQKLTPTTSPEKTWQFLHRGDEDPPCLQPPPPPALAPVVYSNISQ